MEDSIWDIDGVVDVTEDIRRAAGKSKFDGGISRNVAC
jgi:hypothetical protein